MHKGLYHQDVVGLEQEYSDKMAQFKERETKIAKVVPPIRVDLPAAETPSQCIQINTVPNHCNIPACNAVNAADAVAEQCNTSVSIVVPVNPLNNATRGGNEVTKQFNNPASIGVPDILSNNVDLFEDMYPSALEHLIPKLNQPYPHYRVFWKGTKYEYRSVQYELFGPEFIAAPITDAIRTRDGMHEYPVYFTKQMTVLEYREQRHENEDTLMGSTRSKPRTFLAFYKIYERRQQYKPDIRKYQKELYGKYQPWMTFEQIVTRNEINRKYGFLNI